MSNPSEFDPRQQIEAFNQALLRLAEQQEQARQQRLLARHWAVINDLEAELPKRKRRKRSEQPALLQSALTSARHWLIEKLVMLESDETEALPLPDDKDVIVIDANYTIITPERKDTDYGSSDARERTEHLGAAARSDQQSRRTRHQTGGTATTDRGERVRTDPRNRSTGN